MNKLIDLTGLKFNRLTVIKYSGKTKRGISKWLCLCDCNNKVIVNSDSLKNGHTKSCGCLNIEKIKLRSITHGHCKNYKESKTYRAWQHMLDRCNNTKNPNYKDYGDRGITVCDRWNINKGGSFENFLKDMGEPPTKKHQLDRMNNNKLKNGYSPKNCWWTTYKQQQRNKRSNRLYYRDGKLQCVSELAEKYKINKGTLHGRLKRGYSIEEALIIPVKKYKRKKT